MSRLCPGAGFRPVVVLGSFMTWAQAGPFKAAGTDGDGWFTIVLGTAAAVMAWQQKFKATAIVAGLGLAITVSPGVGLFICVAPADLVATVADLRRLLVELPDTWSLGPELSPAA